MTPNWQKIKLRCQLWQVNHWYQLAEATNDRAWRDSCIREARAQMNFIEREQRINALLDELFPESGVTQ